MPGWFQSWSCIRQHGRNVWRPNFYCRVGATRYWCLGRQGRKGTLGVWSSQGACVFIVLNLSFFFPASCGHPLVFCLLFSVRQKDAAFALPVFALPVCTVYGLNDLYGGRPRSHTTYTSMNKIFSTQLLTTISFFSQPFLPLVSFPSTLILFTTSTTTDHGCVPPSLVQCTIRDGICALARVFYEFCCPAHSHQS